MYESSRVKGLSYHDGYLASISSAGDVTVWSVDIPKRNITELCAIDVGCRPVCVTILDLSKFAKEYVLKMEGADEEEENEISDEDEEQSKVEMPKSKKSTGRVVVEVENEDNDKHTKAKQVTKHSNVPKKAGKGKPQNGVSNGGANNSLLSKKKNNKKDASAFVEEDITASPPKSSPINKANKRKSVNPLVEDSGTPSIVKKSKQLNSAKKSQNKLNKTISSFNEGPISSPATRKMKKNRLSLV